ncbi:GNAT family N-acetyltransferase [Streptomyces sp. RFCAC02]|uniref:GNAT family N-acetyltransferase n=1 Tax=Streptomyces sp. RFCAC02 TaxID=2499143 RepID=UPI0010204D34|nr:GNAT family N-acetyltransferase [Streptomyces sp. RFCAC02]
MADRDTPHGSIRLPRRPAHPAGDGYRSGRPCAPGDGGGTARRITDSTGTPLLLRPAGPGDIDAARALHTRCSSATLTRRYPGPADGADGYLRHLLSPRHGLSMAVESAPGHLVALGHLLWDDDEAEVALLVEDAWQWRGVGGELLRSLLALAVRAGRGTVYAVTCPAGAEMSAVLGGAGVVPERDRRDGVTVVSADIGALPAAALSAPAGG